MLDIQDLHFFFEVSRPLTELDMPVYRYSPSSSRLHFNEQIRNAFRKLTFYAVRRWRQRIMTLRNDLAVHREDSDRLEL